MNDASMLTLAGSANITYSVEFREYIFRVLEQPYMKYMLLNYPCFDNLWVSNPTLSTQTPEYIVNEYETRELHQTKLPAKNRATFNTPLLSTADCFFFPPLPEDRDIEEAVELELSLFFKPDPVETTLRTVSERFKVLEPNAALTCDGSMDVRERAERTSSGFIEV